MEASAGVENQSDGRDTLQIWINYVVFKYLYSDVSVLRTL